MRLDLELARRRIDHQLEREAHPGARDAAIGQDRRLVRRHRPGAAAVALHLVRAGEDGAHLRRLETGGERIRGIGAGVDRRLAIETQDVSARVGVQRDVVVVLAAVGVRRELLAPVLDPAHRTPEPAAEPRERDFLRQQDALVAEAAADIGRDHADRALVDAEGFGEPRAIEVRHLRRAVHQQLIEPAVPFAHHAAAFHRRHVQARRADRAADCDCGIALHRREIVID